MISLVTQKVVCKFWNISVFKVSYLDLPFGRRLNDITYLGLLVTRAYSLCKGNKIMIAALVILVGLGLDLLGKEQFILL